MAESNLEVVLRLTNLFGDGASKAAQNLNEIADKIDDLGKKKSVFSSLQEAANDLESSLKSVQERLGNLDYGLGTLGVKSEQAARSANAAKSSISDMGIASSKASENVSQVARAAEQLGDKSAKIKDVAAETQKVADISDSARKSFMGLLGAIDQTQKGNFSPLILGLESVRDAARKAKEQVAALNAEMQRLHPGVPVGGVTPVYDLQRDALQYAKRMNAMEFRNNDAIDVSYSAHNPYSNVLTGPGPQVALNAGRMYESEFAEIAAGFKRIEAQARAAAAAAGSVGYGRIGDGLYGPRSGVNPEALPADFGRNAIMPYTFQGRAEDAPYMPPGDAINAKYRNTRASDYANSGRTINGSFSPMGSGLNGPSLDDLDRMDEVARLQLLNQEAARSKQISERYKSIKKRGDEMQSLGYAGMVNSAMLLGVGAPMFTNSMRTEQLDTQNEITARANGASGESVQFLRDAVHQIAQRNGGDYSDTIASGAAFIGSMTPSANINDAEWQKSIAYALNRASQVSVVSTAGGAPITNASTAVATNQAIANLGYDVSTPQRFGEAVKEVTNMLVKMKNVTPSTVPDTLSFLRAVGPVASLNHVKPEDMAGLIYALGKEKMVGSSAGNAVKRLFQRETLPAKKTYETQEAVKSLTGYDLAMYDAKGKAKSLVDVLDQLAQADKKGHWSDQTRSQVVGQLSGLYANAPIGALLQFMEKNGGKQGLREQGSSIMHKGIEGSGTKDAATAEFERQQKSLANTVQVTTNKIKEAWQGVFIDLEPKFAAIVKGVGDVADWFSHLPAPVRDGAAALGMFVGVATLGYGVFNLLGGNFIKMFGGLMGISTGTRIAADGTRVFISIGERLGGLFKGIGGLFVVVAENVALLGRNFFAMAPIGPMFESLSVAVRGFILSSNFLPIVGWAGLVVAAIAGMKVAWDSDFGGIREITKNTFNYIGSEFKQVVSWFQWLSTSIEKVLSSLDDKLGGIGRKAMSVLNQYTQADREANDRLANGNSDAGNASFSDWTPNAKREKAHAAVQGTSFDSWGPAPKKHRAANAPIDFGSFGSDEGIATPAAPPPGIETPGLHDAMDAIMRPDKHKHHKDKKTKKPKKPHDDHLIDIKDFPADEVEHLARSLEDQWKKKHVRLTPEFIDLKNKSGEIVERVFGDKAAFQQAVHNLTGNLQLDKGLKQQVEAYIERARYWKTGTEKEVNELEAFLKKAKTQGMKSYIEGQIATIDARHLVQLGKIKSDFTKNHNAIYGDEGTKESPTGGLVRKQTDSSSSFEQTYDDANKSFKELIQSQKEGLVTISELKEIYNLLYTEQKNLTSEQEKGTQAATDIATKIKHEEDALKSITGSTRADREARSSLTSQINTEKSTLSDMNSALAKQQTTLDGVTASMNRANTEYQKAVNNQHSLAQAFLTANQAAKTSSYTMAGDLLSGGAQSLYAHITQGNRSGGAIGQLVSNYVNSYISSAAGPLGKMLMPGGGKEDKPQIVTDTKLYGQIDTSNKSLTNVDTSTKKHTDLLTNIDNNTKVLNGMKQNGDGSIPVKSTTTYAKDATQAAGKAELPTDTAAKQDASIKKQNDILQSKTAKLIEGVGGALASTVAGMQQGGIGGAVTAGVGTYTSLTAAGIASPIALPVAATTSLISAFSHHDSPEAMPDKYDTQRYGQMQADILGSGYNGKVQNTAMGTSFVEDNQTAQATDNLGMLQKVQKWAADNIHNSDPSIAKLAQQDQQLYGKYNPNAKSGNDLLTYDLKNIGNESVIGGSEKGSYTSIYNDLESATNAIQQLGSASLQAAQNAKALADSFTANMMGGPSGFSIPYLGSVGGGNASSSFLPTNSVTSSSRNGGVYGVSVPGQVATHTNVNVRILEGATVHKSGVNEVVQAIQDALPMITNAVNQNNYNTSRYMQGYQSQLS